MAPYNPESQDDVDAGVHSLHRYFLWANRMRQDLGKAVAEQGPMPDSDDRAIAAWLSAPLAYQFAWATFLHALVEGWNTLGLRDERIDEMLASPHRETLRRLRNGVAHYQYEYWNDRLMPFITNVESMRWVGHLHDAFEWYFRRWFKEKGIWVQPEGVNDGPLSSPA